MNTWILIPARTNSTRLSRKLLLEVNGKSIIRYTYERANQLRDKNTLIYVVAGDTEIYAHCRLHDIPVIETRDEIPNGTWRVWEALRELAKEGDIVYNWQGDYPNLDPALLEKMQYSRKCHDHNIYSAFYFGIGKDLDVQVVTNRVGDALFFSRKALPYGGEGPEGRYRIHVGLYGFTYHQLGKIYKLKNPYRLENLEQLSWLYHKYKIHMFETEPTISINDKDDFNEFKNIYRT